jgi:hypothetical protein
MSEFYLTLSEGQRELLTRVLGDALRSKRVEIHRTEFSRDYRHELEAEEATMQCIVNKLSRAELIEPAGT